MLDVAVLSVVEVERFQMLAVDGGVLLKFRRYIVNLLVVTDRYRPGISCCNRCNRSFVARSSPVKVKVMEKRVVP